MAASASSVLPPSSSISNLSTSIAVAELLRTYQDTFQENLVHLRTIDETIKQQLASLSQCSTNVALKVPKERRRGFDLTPGSPIKQVMLRLREAGQQSRCESQRISQMVVLIDCCHATAENAEPDTVEHSDGLEDLMEDLEGGVSLQPTETVSVVDSLCQILTSALGQSYEEPSHPTTQDAPDLTPSVDSQHHLPLLLERYCQQLTQRKTSLKSSVDSYIQTAATILASAHELIANQAFPSATTVSMQSLDRENPNTSPASSTSHLRLKNLKRL